MSTDCIFCRIVTGEIPSDVVAEGDEWVAFRDVDPKAPIHILVVPRRHGASVASLEDAKLAGRLLLAAAAVARREGLEEDGYRVVTNHGTRAGQSVFHLHLHVLGGRPMRWPPG
jgi:histidine triad (HIT) family protein